MKKILFLLLIPFLGFSQVIEFNERVADNPQFKHKYEYHVSQDNFEQVSDTIGSHCSAFRTIPEAFQQAIEDGVINAGIKIVLHSGYHTYTDTIKVPYQNVTITSVFAGNRGTTTINGIIDFNGNGSSFGLTNIKVNEIIHSGSAGLYISGVQLGNVFKKTGSGYTQIWNSSIQGSSGYQHTGSGTTIVNGGTAGIMMVNNPSAVLYARDMDVCYAVNIIQGNCGLYNTTCYAIAPNTNAYSAGVGTNSNIENVKFYEFGGETPAKVTFNTGAYYSFSNVLYNKSTSSLTGAINKQVTFNFDKIALLNVPTVTGITNGLVVDANGVISQQEITGGTTLPDIANNTFLGNDSGATAQAGEITANEAVNILNTSTLNTNGASQLVKTNSSSFILEAVQNGYIIKDYDVNEAYLFGKHIVLKDNLFFTPNADIPSGTAFVEGVTGQTWLNIGGGNSSLFYSEFAKFMPTSIIDVVAGEIQGFEKQVSKSTNANIVQSSNKYSGFSTGVLYKCNLHFDTYSTTGGANFALEARFYNAADQLINIVNLSNVYTVTATQHNTSNADNSFVFSVSNETDYIKFYSTQTTNSPKIRPNASYIDFSIIAGSVPNNYVASQYELVKSTNIPLTNVTGTDANNPAILGSVICPSNGIWKLYAKMFIGDRYNDPCVYDVLVNDVKVIDAAYLFRQPATPSAATYVSDETYVVDEKLTLTAGDVVKVQIYSKIGSNTSIINVYNSENTKNRLEIQKIANFLPVEQVPYLTSEYATFTLTANDPLVLNGYIGDNSLWTLDTTQPHTGNITTTSDGFTGFTDNVIYKATFYGDFYSTSGTSYCNWNFQYGSTNGQRHTDRTVDRAVSGGTQQVGSFTFTGDSNTDLKLFVSSIGTGATYYSDSYIKIEAISGKLPVENNYVSEFVSGTMPTNNISLPNQVWTQIGTLTIPSDGVWDVYSEVLIRLNNGGVAFLLKVNGSIYNYRGNGAYSSAEFGHIYDNTGVVHNLWTINERNMTLNTGDIVTLEVAERIGATAYIADTYNNQFNARKVAGLLPVVLTQEAQTVQTDTDPASNITSPVVGSIAWDTTDSKLQIYNGLNWTDINSTGGGSSLVTGFAHYKSNSSQTGTVGQVAKYNEVLENTIPSYVTYNSTTGEFTLKANTDNTNAIYEIEADLGEVIPAAQAQCKIGWVFYKNGSLDSRCLSGLAMSYAFATNYASPPRAASTTINAVADTVIKVQIAENNNVGTILGAGAGGAMLYTSINQGRGQIRIKKVK